MIKNKTMIEVKIGDRIYQLFCDTDSPLGELHDALAGMKAHVVKLITDHEKNEQPKEGV